MNELMDEWMWKQDAERNYIKTKRANIITRWIKLASRQWVLLVWTEMTDTIGFVEPVLNGADTRMEEKGGGSQTELLIAAVNPEDCRRYNHMRCGWRRSLSVHSAPGLAIKWTHSLTVLNYSAAGSLQPLGPSLVPFWERGSPVSLPDGSRPPPQQHGAVTRVT